MTQQTENYPNMESRDAALKRSAPRHTNGWRALHVLDDPISIVWDNTITPPKPFTNMTQKEFIEMLAKQRRINLP